MRFKQQAMSGRETLRCMGKEGGWEGEKWREREQEKWRWGTAGGQREPEDGEWGEGRGNAGPWCGGHVRIVWEGSCSGQTLWNHVRKVDWSKDWPLRVWIAWLRHLHVDSAMVEIQGKESNMEASDPIRLWETIKEAMITWSPMFQNHNLKPCFSRI